MNLMTMFRAYREARGWRETYALHRPQKNFGIAIHKDYDALRWQRYNRLERKLQRRIEADLAAYDAQAARIAELEAALVCARMGLEAPTHAANDYNCEDWPIGEGCRGCDGNELRAAIVKEIDALMNEEA